ncbi:hypothetical protein [Micromonospora sp. HM134]|nr:hypothetical protein [Micromonospora sp. HM134]
MSRLTRPTETSRRGRSAQRAMARATRCGVVTGSGGRPARPR